MPKSSLLTGSKSFTARRTPTQSRATVTRDAVLQASVKVIQQEGLSAFNTNRVAAVAGISVGSLYQYYPNKVSLLCALSVAQHTALLKKVNTTISKFKKPKLELAMEKIVMTVLAHQYQHPALSAALDYAERELTSEPALIACKQALLITLISALAPFRAQLQGDLKVIAMDLHSIAQAIIDAAELRGEKNSPALRARVLRAVLGYLKG